LREKGWPVKEGVWGCVNIPAKVRSELESLLNGEVGEILVTEGDYLALGHESRQLVLAGIAQRRQLDTSDLCADGRSQVGHCHGSLGQQVRIGCVGVLAVLIVLERLEGRILLVAVPGREVVRVLGFGSATVCPIWHATREGASNLGCLVAFQAGFALRVEPGRRKFLVRPSSCLELQRGHVRDRHGLDFDGGGSHVEDDVWCCKRFMDNWRLLFGCFSISPLLGFGANSFLYNH